MGKGCVFSLHAMAFSFSGATFSAPVEYRRYVEQILRTAEQKLDLAVLPAGSALLFAWRCGLLGKAASFREAVFSYVKNCKEINGIYLNVHAELAKSFQLYLICGTILELKGEKIFHTSPGFDREGRPFGAQRQTHLSRLERDLGFSRGNELPVFNTELGRLGIVVGNDAWYPEVGRILALQGAEIVCHPGAIRKESSPSLQLAGMWQQVQQNQFFGVESQLIGEIAGEHFSAQSAIHAPCEMTVGKTGYLSLGKGGEEMISSHLDFAAREEVIEKYPLLSFLNPEAYHQILPRLYHTGETEGANK